MEQGRKTNSLTMSLQKEHILPDTKVGQISIPWQGTGWGQSASLLAMTKKPDGSIARAEGRIVLEEPEETGGLIRDVRYRDLENDKCSDFVDGIIYINSRHYLNKVVFGVSQADYYQRINDNPTAMYRFASLVLEQAVYKLAEETHSQGGLVLSTDAPVTSLREFIDTRTQKFAPRIVKTFVTKKI